MNGENMKIICLEENYLDSELGRACMPVALEQAPSLATGGKPSLMVIILTDSQRRGQLQAFYVCLGLASRSGDPFVAADVIGRI